MVLWQCGLFLLPDGAIEIDCYQARQLSLTLGTRSTKSSVECLIEMSMLVYRFIVIDVIVYFVQYTVLKCLDLQFGLP